MKLFYSPASPYARKVVVAAREAGVIDQIKIINATVSPLESKGEIAAANPIGKVPAMVLDDGRTIFDSRVICEYIDGIGGQTKLVPANLDSRVDVQTLHALGDGILDASLLVRYENFMRPPEIRWDEWTKGQKAKIIASVDYLENQYIELLNSPITIGHIAIGCALGYIDFRGIIEDWRPGHDKLLAWYDEFSKRESMKATEPS